MCSDHMGRASGDCFVELSTQEAFDDALKLTKKSMGRRYIEVFKSSMESLSSAMGSGKGVEFDQAAIILKMRGLPYSASEQDIRDFFKDIQIGMSMFVVHSHIGHL